MNTAQSHNYNPILSIPTSRIPHDSAHRKSHAAGTRQASDRHPVTQAHGGTTHGRSSSAGQQPCVQRAAQQISKAGTKDPRSCTLRGAARDKSEFALPIALQQGLRNGRLATFDVRLHTCYGHPTAWLPRARVAFDGLWDRRDSEGWDVRRRRWWKGGRGRRQVISRLVLQSLRGCMSRARHIVASGIGRVDLRTICTCLSQINAGAEARLAAP